MELMSHEEVCQKYETELLRTIGVHDMETFYPFRTVPCSQPCKRYQRLIGKKNDIAVSVNERSPWFVFFWICQRDQQRRFHINGSVKAKYGFYSVFDDSIQVSMFRNISFEIIKKIPRLASLASVSFEEHRE